MSKLISFAVVSTVAFSVAAFLYLKVQNDIDVHVSRVVVNRPFDRVWNLLSDPNNFATVYPNWVVSTQTIGPHRFEVHDKFGKSYVVNSVMNRESGIIDLMIGTELSRLRIIPVDDRRVTLVHLAKKWKGMDSLSWFFHKRVVDRDFENAKRVIETVP